MRTITVTVLLAGMVCSCSAEKRALQAVTVAQLEQVLESEQGAGDGQLAKRLARVRLTERLDGATQAQIARQLLGRKSLDTLDALAAESAYLQPPASDILSLPMPDEAAQNRLLAQVTAYLEDVVPAMPDLVATERARYFGGPVSVNLLDHGSLYLYGYFNQSTLFCDFRNCWAPVTMALHPPRLKLNGTAVEPVLYQNGQEFTANGKTGDSLLSGMRNSG